MDDNIVIYRLKGRIAEPEGTAIARKRRGKHVPTETDTHATIKELLEAVFSMRSRAEVMQREIMGALNEA
jgi:hypothetical protein